MGTVTTTRTSVSKMSTLSDGATKHLKKWTNNPINEPSSKINATNSFAPAMSSNNSSNKWIPTPIPKLQLLTTNLTDTREKLQKQLQKRLKNLELQQNNVLGKSRTKQK